MSVPQLDARLLPLLLLCVLCQDGSSTSIIESVQGAPQPPSVLHTCDVVRPVDDDDFLTGLPELVAESRSEFGTAAVWRTGHHLQFVINGVLMSDTRDERLYHEMLVVPPLLAARHPPRDVLIIGGGEGATLREVLRDERVRSVTMVDIDAAAVQLCRDHLAAMHCGSFDDPRLDLIFADGLSFVKAAPAGSYDVAIVDGVDFESCGWDDEHVAHGNGLFTFVFYEHLFRVLRPGGALAQYLSEVDRLQEVLAAGFAEALLLAVRVPSFTGGGARFSLATKAAEDNLLVSGLERRLSDHLAEVSTEKTWTYLTPSTLRDGLAMGRDVVAVPPAMNETSSKQYLLSKGGGGHTGGRGHAGGHGRAAIHGHGIGGGGQGGPLSVVEYVIVGCGLLVFIWCMLRQHQATEATRSSVELVSMQANVPPASETNPAEPYPLEDNPSPAYQHSAAYPTQPYPSVAVAADSPVVGASPPYPAEPYPSEANSVPAYQHSAAYPTQPYPSV